MNVNVCISLFHFFSNHCYSQRLSILWATQGFSHVATSLRTCNQLGGWFADVAVTGISAAENLSRPFPGSWFLESRFLIPDSWHGFLDQPLTKPVLMIYAYVAECATSEQLNVKNELSNTLTSSAQEAQHETYCIQISSPLSSVTAIASMIAVTATS